MAEQDWRESLTATHRYGNIQKIEKAAKHSSLVTASAFTLENEAYLSSSSRADYDAACALLSKPVEEEGPILQGAIMEEEREDDDEDEQDDGERADATATETETGTHQLVKIGKYTKCRYVASGVTSDVFQSGERALKVITETKDMQPHDHVREAKILALLRQTPNIISLLETFQDQEQRSVLVFPYMPSSLDAVLRKHGHGHGHGHGTVALPRSRLLRIFTDVFAALAHIHKLGIIHRDVKPSAILLQSEDGPAYLSDFGTAWHPEWSAPVEPADEKVLDVGTGPYRAPEALFGNQAYGPSLDMWAAGAMLAECGRNSSSSPTKPLFESRPAHEDGSQLGLILSIFKTIGTPTKDSWPEAATFKTPPFEMYRVFESKTWEEILPDMDVDIRQLVADLVKYNSSRATAEQALARVEEMKGKQS